MLKMKIQELLFDAVKYEESLLAHAIYVGIQRGLFTLHDSVEKFDLDMLPIHEIVEANKQNILKIKKTKLYAIRRPNHAEYAYYLTEDKESALNKHRELFKEEPLNIYDQSHKRDVSIVGEHEPLSKAKTFWDYKQNATLPYFICLMDAKRKRG